MPVNKNALLRYKTIDECLQNRYRKWTLQDIIDKVSDALYEYEGKMEEVSKRTIQLDLQMMRSNKLGYNAPIVVKERKYYSYEDPKYSITKLPISQLDLQRLSETLQVLRQFQGFEHFKDLSGMVQKMIDYVSVAKEKRDPIIQFETNSLLKGISHLGTIYKAIAEQTVIHISYQTFKARAAQDFLYHAYLLKEYNNRWFVLGNKDGSKEIQILALDRILNIQSVDKPRYKINQHFDQDLYFYNVIGVTVMEGSPVETIEIMASKNDAPYIATKPIHHTQRLISQDESGTTFQYQLKVNTELIRVLLGFGAGIEVLKPRSLRTKIQKLMQKGLDRYESKSQD